MANLAPGDGELFRIVDDVEEYIPLVYDIARSGTRTFYACDAGIVMVDSSNGYRVHQRDGTVFTPVVSIDILHDKVYVCQNNGVEGNAIVRDLELQFVGVVDVNDPLERPTGVVVAPESQASSHRVIVGFRKGTDGLVRIYDQQGASYVPVITLGGLAVNDVAYQPGLGTFVVGHSNGVDRYSTTTFAKLKTWDKQKPIVDVEAAGTNVFAAKADAVAQKGRVVRLRYDLKKELGLWIDYGAEGCA